ncbi:MAG: hypothetical protein Q4D55_07580 [Eubacteriales bacterium]|nr:hypothetical protein [Eubacteriales bacterium]
MDERNNDFDFVFMPIEQAIKANQKAEKSSIHRRLDALLSKVDDSKLYPYRASYKSGTDREKGIA